MFAGKSKHKKKTLALTLGSSALARGKIIKQTFYALTKGVCCLLPLTDCGQIFLSRVDKKVFDET